MTKGYIDPPPPRPLHTFAYHESPQPLPTTLRTHQLTGGVPPLSAAAVWGRSCSRLGRCDDDCLSRAFNRAEGRASGRRGTPPPRVLWEPKIKSRRRGKALTPPPPLPKIGGPVFSLPCSQIKTPHLGGESSSWRLFSGLETPRPDPSRHRSP